jgi:hypothetical protein
MPGVASSSRSSIHRSSMTVEPRTHRRDARGHGTTTHDLLSTFLPPSSIFNPPTTLLPRRCAFSVAHVILTGRYPAPNAVPPRRPRAQHRGGDPPAWGRGERRGMPSLIPGRFVIGAPDRDPSQDSAPAPRSTARHHPASNFFFTRCVISRAHVILSCRATSFRSSRTLRPSVAR